uniref:AAA_12 domain-containing protein n=1 Tax=Heterorhabditis bacteriophora TaxID=37862 RepID=A0A1I7X1Q5_HETBA
MERLSKEFDSANINHLLTVQYRMNSKIMRWSSDQFYNSLLTADESVANITLSDISNISSNHSFIYIICIWEVKLVTRYLEFLQKIGVQEKDIGIITPYYAQVEIIREKILGSQIVVNTVDAFQGQEKEVIIFSMVRHNPERSLGFLREERRLNVAITRARRQFVLIGSARMTERNKCLKKLFTNIKRNGIVVNPTDMDELGYG